MTFKIPVLLLVSIIVVVCWNSNLNAKTSDRISETTMVKDTVAENQFYPDVEWRDTQGGIINAHSGGVYYEDGFYYWYGEDKIYGTSESKGWTGAGMHCYRSKDLNKWTDMGIVLSVDYKNPDSDIAYGCIFQRPKVVRNSKTGKYVAYFKLYLKGNGYKICHTGVATADHPAGPFTYSHKFLAASKENGSGDFALFQDDNGDLYHFAVRKSDRLLVKAKMSDDYMYPATEYVPCPNVVKSTEGVAIMRYQGIYHLIGSGSSGWNPNPARYYTSTSLDGPWTNHGNPCVGINKISGAGPEKTFEGQPTFIIDIQGKENQFILMMDVWKPKDPINSRYIWLPFRVKNDKVTIEWQDSWDLSWFDNH